MAKRKYVVEVGYTVEHIGYVEVLAENYEEVKRVIDEQMEEGELEVEWEDLEDCSNDLAISNITDMDAKAYWDSLPKVESYQDALDWLSSEGRPALYYIFEDCDLSDCLCDESAPCYTAHEDVAGFLDYFEDEAEFKTNAPTMYKVNHADDDPK